MSRISSKRIALIAVVLNATGLVCLGQTRRLQPSTEYKRFWEDIDGPASRYTVRLSRNRKLVAVGDKLYMLDGRNRIVWEWTRHVPLTDAPFVDSSGTIYVIGYDMLWASIDTRTGKQKWESTAVGRASYIQLTPYRDDMYLVVTSMSGYRWNSGDKTIKDSVSLNKGTKTLWETDIPANSRIRVSGEKVFVVFKQKKRIVRWRLNIPGKFVS